MDIKVNRTNVVVNDDQHCFRASKPATETCDRYVACRAKDRNGHIKWGVIAHHGPFGQLQMKLNPKADKRNRICCWLSADAAAAMDELTTYYPSGDEATRLGAPWGYFPNWGCDYNPDTGHITITVTNDRRVPVPEGVANKALEAVNNKRSRA